MKEAWQHNAEFGGFAELLPSLSPATFDDDMANTRSNTVVMVSVFVTRPDGRVERQVVSDKLPTEDYPVHKAISHLAARIAERFTGDAAKVRAD